MATFGPEHDIVMRRLATNPSIGEKFVEGYQKGAMIRSLREEDAARRAGIQLQARGLGLEQQRVDVEKFRATQERERLLLDAKQFAEKLKHEKELEKMHEESAERLAKIGKIEEGIKGGWLSFEEAQELSPGVTRQQYDALATQGEQERRLGISKAETDIAASRSQMRVNELMGQYYSQLGRTAELKGTLTEKDVLAQQTDFLQKAADIMRVDPEAGKEMLNRGQQFFNEVRRRHGLPEMNLMHLIPPAEQKQGTSWWSALFGGGQAAPSVAPATRPSPQAAALRGLPAAPTQIPAVRALSSFRKWLEQRTAAPKRHVSDMDVQIATSEPDYHNDPSVAPAFRDARFKPQAQKLALDLNLKLAKLRQKFVTGAGKMPKGQFVDEAAAAKADFQAKVAQLLAPKPAK